MKGRVIVNMTFSLDKEVAEELIAVAKVQRRNKSSMANYILYSALLGSERRPPENIPDKEDEGSR